MKRRRLESLLALSSVLFSLQIGTTERCFAAEIAKTVELRDPQPTLPEHGVYPSALLSLSEGEHALIVDKKTRTLTVWKSDGEKLLPVDEFAVDLGSKEGNKNSAGDRKTPEGVYFFQQSLDGRQLNFENYGEHIFTTDYPNYFDRLEKKTGNGIWLHAIPDSKSLQRGSHGCVVVRNKVIEALAKYIEVDRTPLIVLDQVEYLSPSNWSTQHSRWVNWAKDWAKSKRQESSEIQIFAQGPKFVLKLGSKTVYAVRSENGLEVLNEKPPLYAGSIDGGHGT